MSVDNMISSKAMNTSNRSSVSVLKSKENQGKRFSATGKGNAMHPRPPLCSKNFLHLWPTVQLIVLFISGILAGDDTLGRWGEVFELEVIPIHAMFMPDQTVLLYGADKEARQGGRGVYEIWDVSSGEYDLVTNHATMTHSTNVIIFCSTMSQDVVTGNVLIIGGDDDDNNGVADVLEFDIETHEIRKHPLGPMRYPRWYATSVAMADGRIFVCGGESGVNNVASSIPEIYESGVGFRDLPGADIPAMQRVISDQRAWWYPHVYVNSKEEIIIIIADYKSDHVYRVSVEGQGSIEQVATRPFLSDKLGPSIMYDIDRVVMLDDKGGLWEVDISDSSGILFTKHLDIGPPRVNGVMVLRPDGRVVINGGCSHGRKQGNEIDCSVRHVQIWDPNMPNRIYNGPNQSLPRLYHSTGLILPDGTVASMGGGAPGPLRNHNAQIYQPGYLFDSETGQAAARPVIESWHRRVTAGTKFRVFVAESSAMITKVTATKPGSVTHARNCDARWLNLEFRVLDSTTLEVLAPIRSVMIPGLWNLNVIDKHGVPSEARHFHVSTRLVPTETLATPSTPIPTTSVPSALPTQYPSSKPTKIPSFFPSGSPSFYPTQSPSTAPSIHPTTPSFCDDDPDLTIWVEELNEDRKCAWLRGQVKERILELCQVGHDSNARSICPESCGVCRDDCEDTNGSFTYNGMQFKCSWLAIRPNAMSEVCHPNHECWEVCPETCGACDAGQFQYYRPEPPTVSMISPAEGTEFAVGDKILLEGAAVDGKGNVLSSDALVWEVRLYHDGHYHKFFVARGNRAIMKEAPSPEDFLASRSSYLEIILTVVDNTGLHSSISRIVPPKIRLLQLDVVPSGAGLEVIVDGYMLHVEEIPTYVVSWENHQLTLYAPDQPPFSFDSWSDGGAQNHTIIVPPRAPGEVPRYVATFR